jgi:hypothetical protein
MEVLRETKAVFDDVPGLYSLGELVTNPPDVLSVWIKAFDSTHFPLVPLALKVSGHDLHHLKITSHGSHLLLELHLLQLLHSTRDCHRQLPYPVEPALRRDCL